MKDDVRDRWVKALRSGEIEQGQGYLAAGNRRCCLGVLCDLAVEDGVIRAPRESSSENPDGGPGIMEYGQTDDRSGNTLNLPDAVYIWAELDGPSPAVPELPQDEMVPDASGGKCSLEGLNDSGQSFDQIADRIEANF